MRRSEEEEGEGVMNEENGEGVVGVFIELKSGDASQDYITEAQRSDN